MANIFSSSIGKKIIMSISGLFLILFLLVHLTINFLVLLDSDGAIFIAAAHFMGTNPIIRIMEPMLLIGFFFHIFYGIYLAILNNAARPVQYAVPIKTEASWSSKNMLITGFAIFAFLVVHIWNYFYKIKFTDLITSGQMNEAELVKSLFLPERWYFLVFYIISFILLGLHLNHSLQSAFQTMGLNNKVWLPRLKIASTIYAIVIAVGFSLIPIVVFFKAYIN